MASVKARAKRHALIKKAHWESSLPEYTGDNDRIYLIRLAAAMNEVAPEVRQKLVIDYWKAMGNPVDGFSKVSPFYFLTASNIVYLKNKEIHLHTKYDRLLIDTYARVQSMVKPEPVDTKKKVSVKDNVLELAKKYAAEIDAAIDQFCTVGTKMDVKSYLAQNNASAPVCMAIASFYTGLAQELKIAKSKKDEQLVEGYSHIPTRGLNNFILYVDEIVSVAEQMSAVAKSTKARKPRAKKEKPPSVIANKVQYLKEYPELELKSITPEKVVGATQVWVFNTKYRKFFKYEALDGMTLTWKGTTLQNFDPTKSGAKTIRKPELFMKDAAGTTRRRLERLFGEIKGVLAKATGRINEEVIIVRVF